MTSQSHLKNRAEALINALASEFGIRHTVANGEFNMMVDHIRLEIKSRANMMVLYTNIHQVPSEDSLDTYKKLLSLSWNKNTYFQEGLSIDNASENIYLSKKIDTQSLSDSDFLLSVEDFLNTSEHFSNECSKFVPPQEKNHYRSDNPYSKPHYSMNKEA